METDRYTAVLRVLLSAGILCQGCDSAVKCRNDMGAEVDWYVLYKYPNVDERGSSYLYMDESTDGWMLSNKNIDSSSGTLANTLKPYLDRGKKIEGFGYMLYSDQPPEQNAAPPSFGHSKGVVMLDKNTGVWLSHSTPKFPVHNKKAFWPSSGNANAQTFMCVTFSYDKFKEIGLQLMYIHAYSYDSDVPKTFHNELRCVAQRSCYPKKEPWFRVVTLTSLRGRNFLSLAKYKRFGGDLYSGLVAKTVASGDLYVKSWGKMRRPLSSNCSASIPARVYNVKKVTLPETQPFSDTVDHSKWSVTSDGGLACIADMNREQSQMERGGGAICTKNRVVGAAFKRAIADYERCPRPDAGRREL